MDTHHITTPSPSPSASPTRRASLNHRISISRTEGSPNSVDGWRVEEMTLGELLTGGTEASSAGPTIYCPAVVAGTWRDPLIASHADILVLELAGGVGLEDLMGQLAALGLECFVQATEQHLRTTTVIKACEFESWIEGAPGVELFEWVLEQELDVTTRVTGFEPTIHQDCPAWLVRHQPVTSWRLIFPLAEPFAFRVPGEN